MTPRHVYANSLTCRSIQAYRPHLPYHRPIGLPNVTKMSAKFRLNYTIQTQFDWKQVFIGKSISWRSFTLVSFCLVHLLMRSLNLDDRLAVICHPSPTCSAQSVVVQINSPEFMWYTELLCFVINIVLFYLIELKKFRFFGEYTYLICAINCNRAPTNL